MARRRLFTVGPSVGSKIPRITTSDIRMTSRNGVILRNPVGNRYEVTNKSVLRPKQVRGITQPGYQTPNYPSPLD